MKRMFTKALNLFSVLLLLVAIGFSFFAVAQPNEASAAWDGTVATSFSSGSGTAASPYVISSESQLGYFMAQLASGVTYEGQYIQLSKSLNMTGSIWDTSHYTAFGGTFDGQGYTITADCPFMTVIGKTGVVQGLNYNTYHIQLGRALICDTNNGVIRSCTAYGDVYATSGSPVYGGMICTKNTGTVENCGAIGALYASGDDTSAYAAMVPQNTGTVTGCYSAITVKALGTGKYSEEDYCPVSHRGIATNSFYDITLHPYTAHCGEGLTTAELQSDAFLTSLQGTSVSGTRWVKGSHGYPELTHCSTSYAYVSGYQGNTDPIIYSGTSKTITLYSSSTSKNIYYTLDGTDPTTSSTRKTLYSGYTMSISGDTVLTMVPYYNGTYGTVTRQTFINLQGSGTEANPYKITTKRQLDAIRMLPDKIFALKNDLTFTDADFTLGGIAAGGWTPIPNFSGKLDGEGHAITGLRSNHGGLFNDVETGATVTSLRLMDHKLCSPGDFGAIAKHNYGTITRCYVKSAFTVANAPSGKEPNSGFPYIGGVVAFNRGTVSYCRNDGLTVGLGVARYGQVYVGGITGSNQGTLKSCVNFGGILLRNNAHADNGYFGGITGTGDVYEANCRSRCDMTLQNSFDYSVVCTGMSGEDPYLACVASLCIADPFTVSWSIPTSYSVPTTNKYAISGISRDSYTLQDRAIAESYPKLNFTSDWMFTVEGPMPQGVMDADGHCLRTSAYIVPSCTKTGSVTLYCELCSHVETQTLEKIPHSYSAYVSDGNATCLEDGTKTRTCADCGLQDTVADEGSALGHTYANGFCGRCDARESAADKNNDGIWEIGNAGQLYWFAELVKGGQTTASAVLTENITVNSGVLTADGALNSGSFRSWNPIGHYDYMYEGTFDGCGHTVSGLYMNARAKYCALFGYVGEGGTVRNLGLTDSYIKGDLVIGGIAASCSGLIENCFNTATVIGINEIGGISGSLFNSGVIRSCYNAGRIQDTGSAVDIAGIVSYVNSSATVENCFYLDSSETDHYDSTTAMNDEQFASGEVAWKLNGDQSSICFRQTCGQGLPAFTGSQVFRNQVGGCTTNAEYRYSNTQEVPVLVHTFNVYTGNGDATCLEDGTRTAKCDLCDATDTVTDAGTALGHSFTHYISDGNEGCYMDGTETAKCDRCETIDTRTEAGSAGHLFTNYISNNNATCIYPGTKTAKCDRCNVKDTQVEIGSQKGHSFTNYVSNGDATCLTDGTKTAKCDRCTVTETLSDEGSALGHSFTNYVSDGNVTCTEDGTQTAKCDRCDVTDTIVLEALGHDMSDWFTVTDPSCTASGLEQSDCARCDHSETRIIPVLPHSYEGTVTVPTCTTPGYTTYTCSCGDSYTGDHVPVLAHSFTDYVSDGNVTCTANGTQTAKCDRCDVMDTIPMKALGHSFTNYTSIGNATCTADGLKIATCDRCSEMNYAVDAGSMLGHSFTQYVSNDDATCLGNGTETAKCDRCDKTDTREDEDSALGHDLAAWYTVTEATCTEEGLERADCSRCDHSETLPIPATGHSYTEEIIDPTCTEGGYTTHTCSGCGDTYVDSLTEATGHSFVDYTANSDASCTADGTETGTCHVCGATDTRTAEGSALGHEMSGWYTVTESTCTEEGLKQTDCVRCDHSETSGIPATGHHYEAQVTKPTCTEDGYTTHTCRCGDNYVDSRTEKLGHSFTQYVSNEDATCTEDGTETAKCDRCDETDTHPLAGSSPGHNMGQWYTATEASCTEEGLKRSDCSRCDHFEAERIPVAAHSYDEVILTPPTCTEDGYTTHTCHCGDNYVDSYTEALGHTCNEWIPDETFDWETGECTRCHEVVSREFPHPSGSFDFGLTWRFNEKNGILTVSGNGYMEYFDSAMEQPWYEYSDLITGLVVKEGVRSLGGNAFAQCYNLVSVTLPQGLEQIQTSAFQDCLSLISITIPETVTHVGEHAFEGCSKLQEIMLPEGISEVSSFLFANCTGLKKVTLPNTVTRIAYDAFINCKALTEITIPDGVTEIGDYAFQNCTSLTSIQLPDSVTTLGDTLFSGCTSLVSAKLPANIRVISWCMFQSCSSLESFVIPNRVSVIESSAFSDCTSLVSVEIPESVIRIDSSAFAYCTSLTSVKLPGRLTTIANQVFSCAGLTSVEIPASVTTIENYAFGTCRELSEIYFMGDPCEIQQTAFTEVTATAYYPSENTAWTEDMLQNYGGNLTWKPCCYNGHTEVQDTPIAPSCEEAGYANGTHCSVCSEIMDTPEIIPALGHSFTQYVSNGDATCTDEGTETAKCDRCDVVDTRLVENSNLGHDLKDWNILTMPTCVEEGLEESICSRCGHSETRILPATGIHDYSETILTLPTCTEQGYTTHNCYYCGDSYVDSYTETIDHSFSHYVSDGNATCTEDGTKTAKCDWCDETDTVTDVGSVDGHWLIDCWQVVIAPTCTTEGLETATCAKCGVYQESHEIPIIEHSYEAAVTEPTCTKQGYTTHTCRYCGDSYKNTYMDATGHDFGKWYASKDKERRDCENCDHYETRALPNQKPDAPVLSITGNTTTGKPKISWKAIDGAGKYQIYRSTKKTSGFKYLKSTKTATSFTDTSAEAGVTYYYKVKAYHAVSGLSSDWSNTVSRVCDLAKPTVSISIKTATGQPVVKWETVEGAAKYQVYRSEKKSSGYKLVYTGVTARSYTDKTAKPGITYYYKVKAVHTNSSANSAYSAVVSQVCDLAKPVVTIKLSSGDPRLTWKKIPGAAKYRVYRSSTKDGEYKLVKTTVSATSFTDKEAKAGKTWYYKVRAIHENSSANSAYSSIVSIKAK